MAAKPNTAGQPNLSKRQLQVLEARKEGLSYKEISGELKISVGTIKKHLAKACQRLGARNPLQALSKL